MGDECEMCPNCKRDIPAGNYRMHTLHCARNVVLCKECDEPIPRSMMEEHQEEAHTERDCKNKCGAKLKQGDVEKHLSSECSNRELRCQYCEIDVKAGSIMEHEGYCGSRTEPCPECGDFVMLRDWEEHQKMTLYHELAKKPSSQVFGYDPRCPPIMPSRVQTAIASTRKYSTPSVGAMTPTSARKYSQQAMTPTSARKYSTPSATSMTPTSVRRNSQSSLVTAALSSPSSSSITAKPARSNTSSRDYFARKYSLGSSLAARTPSSEEDPGMDPFAGMPPLEALPKSKGGAGYEGSVSKFGGLTFGACSEKVDVTSLLGGTGSTGSSSYLPDIIGGLSTKREPEYPSIRSYEDHETDSTQEEETKIPCEFCEEPISIIKLISHQTHCSRNMDSLYFNAHTVPRQSPQRDQQPPVVQHAMYGREEDSPDAGILPMTNTYHDTLPLTGRYTEALPTISYYDTPTLPMTTSYTSADTLPMTNGYTNTETLPMTSSYGNNKSPPHLISFADDEEDSSPPPMATVVHHPPPLPPKTKINGLASATDGTDYNFDMLDFGGAKPKRKSSTVGVNGGSSIVGKYLGGGSNSSSSDSRGPSSGRSNSKKEKNSLNFDSLIPPKSIIPTAADSSFKSRNMVDTSSEIDRQNLVTKAMAVTPTPVVKRPSTKSMPAPQPPVSLPAYKPPPPPVSATPAYKPSSPPSMPSAPTYKPKHLDDYMPPPRALRNREINPEQDMAERDKLREMLSNLRKDPFDETLENNDGSFFPCEFCGDPYPVEFLMRHQLSCDLNPAPVTSGQGFDYSLIRDRAQQNLDLSKNLPNT